MVRVHQPLTEALELVNAHGSPKTSLPLDGGCIFFSERVSPLFLDLILKKDFLLVTVSHPVHLRWGRMGWKSTLGMKEHPLHLQFLVAGSKID